MKSEDRKQLICNYIERNPFSTIREIADNFKNGKSSNYYVVQNDISKLLDDNRIESLSILIGNKQVEKKKFDKTKQELIKYEAEIEAEKDLGYYYIKPNLDNVIDLIIKLIKSEKIFKPVFKNIVFKDYSHSWSFQQIISNLISEFLISLSVSLILEKKNGSTMNKKKLMQMFSDSFVNEYLEGFRHLPEPKPKSLTELLKRFEYAIWHYHDLVNKRYQQLRFHGKTLEERLDLMKKALDDDWIFPEEKRMTKKGMEKATTRKGLKSRLKPILISPRMFSWVGALYLQSIEEGNLIPDLHPKIYKLALKQLQKDAEQLPKPKKEQILQLINKKSKIRKPTTDDLVDIELAFLPSSQADEVVRVPHYFRD